MAGRLEQEFEDVVAEHGDKVSKAYKKAKELSEKYGIPFGSYIPKSFKKFRTRSLKKGEAPDTEHEDYYEGDDILYGPGAREVDRICDMDDCWLSSTTECEFYQ